MYSSDVRHLSPKDSTEHFQGKGDIAFGGDEFIEKDESLLPRW
jgi:hypothetical protein